MEHYYAGNARSAYPPARYSCQALGLLLLLIVSVTSYGATVPTNEAAMDEIFGAGNFGAQPIDIRFNAQMNLVDPDLVSIDNAFEWDDLLDLDMGLASTDVHMFVVEQINYCGNGTGFIGCAQRFTNRFAVDIDHTDTALGPVLYAHELAHNLGLDHLEDPLNVMRGTISSGNTLFNTDQVMDIFDISNVILQSDTEGFFIEITPILFSATAVPLPAGFILMASALSGLGIMRQRNSVR